MYREEKEKTKAYRWVLTRSLPCIPLTWLKVVSLSCFPISVPSSCLAYSFILKIEAASSSGSLVTFYHTTVNSRLSGTYRELGAGAVWGKKYKTLTETQYKVKIYFHTSSCAGGFLCDILYWKVKDFSCTVK